MSAESSTLAKCKSQPIFKFKSCNCGERIQYITCAPKRCGKCNDARKHESWRVAAEVQRRKKGIAQIKGAQGECDECGKSFIRLTRTHRFCDEHSAKWVPLKIDGPIKCKDCKADIGDRSGLRGPLKKRCEKCRKDLAKKKSQAKAGVEIPLGTTIRCETCDNSIVKTAGSRRFCEECADRTRVEKDLERYYTRQGREPPLTKKGDQTACAGCAGFIVKTRADHIYCEECIQLRTNEYTRAKREAERRADGIPIGAGIEMKCFECSEVFVRNQVRAKYCKKCESVPQARWQRHKRKTDPVFALNQLVSAAIRKSLRGGKAGRSWESLVGYTITELKRHLERQFTSEMNWQNRGSYWELEHIRPVASFKFKGPDCQEFRDCWGILNLRPLSRIENAKKSDQRIYLI